jgi:hypothetical protein
VVPDLEIAASRLSWRSFFAAAVAGIAREVVVDLSRRR